MFTIVATGRFMRSARRFLKQHPDLEKRFEQLVDDLKQNPFAPHLAYHRLGGKLKDVQAVTLTDSYRIILTVLISEKEVILLDIGSHDEVYR